MRRSEKPISAREFRAKHGRGRRDGPHERLVRHVVEHIQSLGGDAWKIDTGMMPIAKKGVVFTGKYRPYGTPGVSDVIGVIHGVFVAVEVKTGTGRLDKGDKKKRQTEYRDRVRLHGGIWHECHVRDMNQTPQLIAALAELEQALKEARA